MRAHQIMSRNLVTVSPETTVEDAAKLMLTHRISGLPVVDAAGDLIGIVSESDFLRRSEIGTAKKRSRFLQFLFGPGASARDFVHGHGNLVQDEMTPDPTVIPEDAEMENVVSLMEREDIKRLPVVQGRKVVGIVTRSNIMQAVADLARDVPDPTADDQHIRDRVVRAVLAQPWTPIGFRVGVRDGEVHVTGLIVDPQARDAVLVAARSVSGVTAVHDHLTYVDTWSGFYVEPPKSQQSA